MSFRRLSKNALASVFTAVATAVLLFELYRFLVVELGAANIGIWSLVMAVSSAARLGEFGLGNSVVKYVAGDLGAGQPASAAGTVAMSALGIAGIMALVLGALWPIAPSLLTIVLPDAQTFAAAMRLLPWALGSLWLLAVANVFAGALDAAQRTDLRTWSVVGAGVIQLGGAYWWVPQYGLDAMGPVQVLHAGAMLLATAAFTITVIRQPLGRWTDWSGQRAVELLRYGGNFQLAAIGQLAFEPSIKWLLGLFGNLTLTGYFELANRAVSQLRQVIGAAYQMLVPYVAARIGQGDYSRPAIAQAYLHAWRLLVLGAVPYFALIAAGLPVLLSLWIGQYEPVFILIGLLALLGWAANTAAIPAFTLYLAIGRQRWSVLTQFTIGACNLVFASIGGWLLGGMGVLIGAMLALALGSQVVVVAFHREFGIRRRTLVSARSGWLAGLGALFAGLAIWQSVRWAGQPGLPWSVAGLMAVYGLTACWLIWQDPLRAEIARRLASPGPSTNS